MYENGKPFFKEWDIVILFEGIVGDFHTSVRMFMKFVKDSLNSRKGRHMRIVSCTKFGVEDWLLTVGFVMYRLIRLVDSSMKSCENLL